MKRLLFVLFALSGLASAQPADVGSSDDIFELGAIQPRQGQATFGAFAGFAYVPDAWRSALRIEADLERGRLSIGVGQTLHPGLDGLYHPEADHWSDVASVLRYARFNPTLSSRLYARVGPTEHTSLASGALVRQYGTTAAWDDRRIGFEVAAESDAGSASGFVDNLNPNGVAGAQAELKTRLGMGFLSDLRFAAAAVHDLGLKGDAALTGIEGRIRGRFIGDGTFEVLPFVSHARLLNRGAATGIGVDAGAENINNLFRASTQIALFLSTSRFSTGLFGPFYAIQNGAEQIAVASSFYDDQPGLVRAGTPIDSMRAGADLVLGARVVAFGSYEVASHFRRHFGADKASAFGIRVAAQLGNGARAEFALEREGFRSFLSLFRGLGEENQLILDVSAPVGRDIWMLVQSRYGFRQLSPEESGTADTKWYLVERRFEPMIGFRARL